MIYFFLFAISVFLSACVLFIILFTVDPSYVIFLFFGHITLFFTNMYVLVSFIFYIKKLKGQTAMFVGGVKSKGVFIYRIILMLYMIY